VAGSLIVARPSGKIEISGYEQAGFGGAGASLVEN
jgi:hypothetical protein